MTQNRKELLKHLAASLKDAQKDGGAILLVGAGISVSAGIPPAQKLMKIAIENFPNYFTEDEQRLAKEDLNQLQYNDIMTKLSNVKRKELFKWFIEGDKDKNIDKAKLNFAHIAIAELLKQKYFSRILTVNFDPLLIHACYMVGMYPFPAIYDLGAIGQVNAELLHDPSIVYLNGQHIGFVQRNTDGQLKAHEETLKQIVRSTGCKKPWIIAGYSGENDPLMKALSELRPYNNWLYWLEYSNQVLQKESHHFLENDEECKVIYDCDADETFMEVAEHLKCNLDFIERPEQELETYLKEIHFNSKSQKIKSYQTKIHSYIELFEKHRLEIQQIANFHSLFDNCLNLLNLDESHKKNNLVNERIQNLYELKLKLEEALLLSEKNYASLLFLTYTCLSIYQIKKANSILEPPDNQLIDTAINSIERAKITPEYKNNNDNEITTIHYNQACINALKGNIPDSLAALKIALDNNDINSTNYVNKSDIFDDPDFNELLELSVFKSLIDEHFKDVNEQTFASPL